MTHTYRLVVQRRWTHTSTSDPEMYWLDLDQLVEAVDAMCTAQEAGHASHDIAWLQIIPFSDSEVIPAEYELADQMGLF